MSDPKPKPITDEVNGDDDCDDLEFEDFEEDEEDDDE